MTILVNELPKPEACWSNTSYEICEKLVLIMAAHRDLDLNPGSQDCTLSRCPKSQLGYLV